MNFKESLEKLREVEIQTEFEEVMEKGIYKAQMKSRNKINKNLGKLTYNRYFESIPLQEIRDILSEYNLDILDEEGNPWSGIICGREGNIIFPTNNKNIFLKLAWYKMESGRYEIITYI